MSDPGIPEAKRCAQCGAEFLPAASPLGLCPACLLKLGASDPAWKSPASDVAPSINPVLAVAASSRARRSWRQPRVWVTAIAALAVLAYAILRVPGPRNDAALPPNAVVRFALALPDETDAQDGAQFAVSPDGTQIVLAARGPDGQQRLWVRPLQSMQWRQLAGTDGAALPFWSPDSRDVGFFAERRLKRIDVSSGLTRTVCDARTGRGATWGSQDIIVFAPSVAGPLFRVDASGGEPQPATALDRARGAAAHSWPHFLPDGRRFLFVASADARTGGGASAGLYVGSLGSSASTLIVPAGGPGAFSQGFLLSVRGMGLVAQRFDPHRAEVSGDARQISGAEQIGGTSTGESAFSVSATGVLVHQTSASRLSHLTWIDRSGRAIDSLGEPGSYRDFSVSPDGRRVAFVRGDERDGAAHIWLMDRGRNVTARLTSGPSPDLSPVWSPDGLRVAFASRHDVENLYVTTVDGVGKEEVVLQSPESKHPRDWSPDGRFLLYSTESDGTGSDLWVLPLGQERKPTPLLQNPSNESDGRFSPDGRWMAYVSDESGSDEVYVRSFPQLEARWQISVDGGSRPRWRADGRELFFVSRGGQLSAVDVQSGPALRSGTPRVLFPMRPADQYEVSPDGRQFLVKMPLRERDSVTLQVVLNWTAELGRSQMR